MTDFVHLHLHSQYSLLDGANRLDDVIQAAAAAGMPAISLTDHGNLFGAIEFYDKARKAGIKPIIGIEAYVAQGSLPDRNPARGSSNHLVLLARNQTGYQNLIKLTTRSYLQGFYYKPRIDHETLREFSEGLIGLSACLKGEINERILSNREAEAEAGRASTPIFSVPRISTSSSRTTAFRSSAPPTRSCGRMSRKLGLGLVVTNDCHYLQQSDSVAHDVLLCIGTQRARSDPDRLKYASDQFYLKSGDELAALFPDDGEAIENTVAIAERCNVEIPSGMFHLPDFPLPPGESIDSFFEHRAKAGLEERFEEMARRGTIDSRYSMDLYRERLKFEIEVIKRMGFPGYFLIVWDFIRFARESGIPVGPGTRLGRRLAGLLRAAHHRHRSDAVRPALRALPEPRARQHARHRHRLLHAAPGRGDPVRQREVRPRSRGADHHLRNAGREGRACATSGGCSDCRSRRWTGSPSCSRT